MFFGTLETEAKTEFMQAGASGKSLQQALADDEAEKRAEAAKHMKLVSFA